MIIKFITKIESQLHVSCIGNLAYLMNCLYLYNWFCIYVL